MYYLQFLNGLSLRLGACDTVLNKSTSMRLARLKAPINQLSQLSKIDSPIKYTYPYNIFPCPFIYNVPILVLIHFYIC